MLTAQTPFYGIFLVYCLNYEYYIKIFLMIILVDSCGNSSGNCDIYGHGNVIVMVAIVAVAAITMTMVEVVLIVVATVVMTTIIGWNKLTFSISTIMS